MDDRSVRIYEETEIKSYNAMGVLLEASDKLKKCKNSSQINYLVDLAYDNPKKLLETPFEELISQMPYRG